MAASEFLSQREESNASRAAKSSLYTGIAYVVTVILPVLPFRRRFLEMLFISMGVAALSFGIGWFVRTFPGLEV